VEKRKGGCLRNIDATPPEKKRKILYNVREKIGFLRRKKIEEKREIAVSPNSSENETSWKRQYEDVYQCRLQGAPAA